MKKERNKIWNLQYLKIEEMDKKDKIVQIR